MDAKWRLEGSPFRYEGGADRSADVDYGFRVDLVNIGSGEKRAVNIEAVSGRPDDVNLREGDARQAVREYLADDDPPRRILLLRDGSFQPEPPATSAS